MIKNGKMVNSKSSIGNISRTKFNNEYNFRSTFSAGFLFPIYAGETLPSSEKSIDCAELVRSITPLGPVMDNAFLDIFFFAVPKRLLWDHWEEFIAGYNKEAWAQDVEYTVPKIKFKSLTPPADYEYDNEYAHSFLDYLPGACDVPMLHYLQHDNTVAEVDLNNVMAIDALYPRAYVKIWNDWFRDENLQDELELYTGDNDEYADEFSFDLLDATKLPKAAKYHNRFTSALPAPQKGPDVLIPMNNLEVSVNAKSTGSLAYTNVIVPAGSYVANQNVKLGLGNETNFSNPVVNNVSNTIRMLNVAYQTEMFLAKDGVGGTRYIESILSHFHVTNGDARLQRSEYLGSMHIPLQTMQVTNTAASASNPLGNVGGVSVTKDSSHYFSKAFTEHCIVLGLAVVRTNLSYSSGVRKMYQRFTRFDHVWPEFKHVGHVPLYVRELEVNLQLMDTASVLEDPDVANKVFGYTPYGSELREGFNYNNGLFRARAANNLSYLTYQENYETSDVLPTLSSEYIEQPTDIVSNTLAVQTGPQFYALFSIHEERVEPIDPTSDFSLIGHF